MPDPPSIHRILLSSWNDPHALNEPYAWDWIGYHLVNAGLKPKLQELLLDFSWLDAKLRATNVNSLLVDFDLLGKSRGVAC
jgi:hypothetical protein